MSVQKNQRAAFCVLVNAVSNDRWASNSGGVS